jgi:hypothetical protein
LTNKNELIDDYYSGDTLKINYTVYRDEAKQERKDLRQASAEWILAEDEGYTPIVTKTSQSGGGIQFTNARNGELTVTIEPSDTESISGTKYHELEITDAQGDVSTVASGDIVIDADTAT